MPKANRVHSTPRRTASKRKASPTKKSTPQPASPAVDPIWAVIEKHRQERAAYAKADRKKWAEIDIPDGATDEMLAAGHLLLTTRPTTLLGVIALLRYVGSEQREENDLHEGAFPICLPQNVDGEIWVYPFFETIADALAALCGRKAVAS
jgi:hypothetical protein